MKPLRLTLENFAGIKSGIGKSVITIDFQDLAADAKIVAIAGPNGIGKTTLIDNMHPYRVMPSRSKVKTPAGFSFYEQLVGPVGRKELLWENCGVRYLSELRFKTGGKQKKTEAYLFVVKADGTKVPWSDAKTGLQSDGKADSYDAAIEAILGSPEVFFAAQFGAQGKQSLASMSPADVKRLISEMIGATESTALSEKSMGVVKALRPHLAAMQEESRRLNGMIPSQDAITAAITSTLQKCAQLQAAITAAEREKTQIELALTSAGQHADRAEHVRQQHAAHQASVELAEKEHRTELVRLTQEHDKKTAEILQARHSAGNALRSALAFNAQVGTEQVRLQALVAQAQAIHEAKQSQTEIIRRMEKIEQWLLEKTPELLQADEIQASLMKLEGSLAAIKKTGEGLVQLLEAARQTASLLGEVPCKGSAMAGQCKLLADAHKASHGIAQTEIKIVNARTEYASNYKAKNGLSARLTEIRATAQQADEMKKQRHALMMKLTELQPLLSRENEVAEAGEKLPSLKLQADAARKAIQEANDALLQAVEQENQAKLVFQQSLDRSNESHQARMQGLQKIKESLPPLDPVTDIAVLQAHSRALEERLAQDHKELASLEKQIAIHEAAQERAKLDREQLGHIQAQAQRLEREIASWTVLAKALGVDGIVAMCIDDAGPAISVIANQLLEDCYGGRFAISMVTQKETVTGVAKETFQIAVEDNDRGESKFFEDLSGGEKVWINECLVRAISLYMVQVSDVKSQTLFSDETDGPLDESRKRDFMQMKRACIERGGYDREYIITQTPELVGMCDAVIDLRSL